MWSNYVMKIISNFFNDIIVYFVKQTVISNHCSQRSQATGEEQLKSAIIVVLHYWKMEDWTMVPCYALPFP